jgi:hypothetical protein
MFREFSRPSSGAQLLQWQLLVLPPYRGDTRTVFVVGPAGRQPEQENSLFLERVNTPKTREHKVSFT